MSRMRVEEVAESVALAFLAIKRHVEAEISLKAGLYQAAKSRNPRTNILRLARRLLHVYAIGENRVDPMLNRLLMGEEVSEDSKILLKLLISGISAKLNLGDPEELVMALRGVFKKLWPSDIEPWIGVVRAINRGAVEIPVVENYPPWFIGFLFKILGREEAHELMRFQDEVKPVMYAAVNSLKLREQEILKELEKSGIELDPDPRLPGIYVVKSVEETNRLIKFIKSGLILIQDFSSYYAVYSAELRPEMNVLDVCAAPGSKTMLMGIQMRNRGLIISVDSSPERIKTHLMRVRKAGLEIVEDVAADATIPLPFSFKADVVLLDPPCSSTGLFWRETAYRWLIKPRHVKMFAKLQARMLENSARHVRENGCLIYSTCSISLEENEILMEDFLKRHSEFKLIEIDPALGSGGLRGFSEARRLYPHRDLCNGFFIAKLLRRW
ncbi:MAG: RsmB/NOP family class I SAM-dependent RNA methyltransferase [Aigarchaeota archaeon]|nr:RsmB/NOP family class I SAM-dependent RNA methyltransferase [Aigarchaeota archaeon]